MNYHLLLKMGDAEIRAWKNLSSDRKRQISVHCEITRGRKKPNKDKLAPAEYNIGKQYWLIENEFHICQTCVVDITREPTLFSTETEDLGRSANGYHSWVSKVAELHEKNPTVRPTLIVNPTEGDSFDQFQSDLFAQFDSFSQKYDRISYRASVLHDEGFLDDIDLLSDRINEFCQGDCVFEVVLDFECLQPSTAPLHASYAAPIVRDIRAKIPKAVVVCLGTSFPKSVTAIGDEARDEFRLEEAHLYREINRTHNEPVEYGDYGSINPIRNDFAPPVGIHLRARVDFPTDKGTIYYHRVAPRIDRVRKVLLSARSAMYKAAAKNVVQDKEFSVIGDSWGFDKVEEAASKSPSGSSPNFWISVRMEMHICRRLDAIAARQEPI
ncbi:hypothetical protein RKLH11_1009 [Rhodobacteraceae bacterium KLH11]|nr:hypothetical protein RKLH11_1009 [Rhodobacteraceae bacterium KLH11]